MLKNGLIVVSSILMVLLFNLPASAASPVGKWSVTGKCTATAIVAGKKYTLNDTIQDKFTFSKNGKFTMIGMSGTWKQKNGRFVIYINTAKIENYVESFCSSEGYKVEVDITTNAFSGTATTKKISGSFTLKANVYVSGKGNGTLSMSWPFTGKPLSSRAEDNAGPDEEMSLMQVIGKVLPETVSGAASPLDASPGEPVRDRTVE